MDGGSDSYVDRFEFHLLEMRNASEDTRRDLFEWWLSHQIFDCIRCGAEFTPNVASTEEGEYIVCPKCAAKR